MFTRLFLALFFCLLFSLFFTSYAVDLEQCEEGGSCHDLRETVEAVIESLDCRNFYVTGKCSEACFRELQRIFLYKKELWIACSLVCWTETYRELIEGWASLCESHRSKESGKEKVFNWLESATATGRENLVNFGKQWTWRWWLQTFFYLVALFCFLVFGLVLFKFWKQRRKQPSHFLKKTLDIDDRPDSFSLLGRRGARRHLFKLLVPESWNKQQ
ncbi:hypothetical protein Gasu2_06280 [Galdieria sulphuraria]|uniref:Transmembrane protein n=1 Tax=Galdieria sulphuraria TaxID=130081 RepID=M2Y1Z9_GALSU|nr:uncharacterized protein Gasu_25770 [Galdieria sulphuraria]EME29988.1 hypothetical protein Gasu_25770 [Galdieria sulphuraria]GJD06200.1 hypothetical protein Gasu2_06280 [Galdieria sulphuraria]|eukprot:XP_005706508.1 hypothetical protein Gasu_25770 [Galdieria sulphuraria]